MGKYFKDYNSVPISEKRFKQTNLPNNLSIREAGLLDAISKSEAIFSNLKNFFWAWNKTAKNIKLNPTIITNLEQEWLKITKGHKAFYDNAKKILDDINSDLDDLDNLKGKYSGYKKNDPKFITERNKLVQDQAKAEADLATINKNAKDAIDNEVKSFNQKRNIPLFLRWSGSMDNPVIDWGILSTGQSGVVDVEGLKDALVLMREIAPANVDPLKRIVSIFRGGLGMIPDTARPLRNISRDLTIKNYMNNRTYVFEQLDPNTGKVMFDNAGNPITKEFTLGKIMEDTANNGHFNPGANVRPKQGEIDKIRSDFDGLINRTAEIESSLWKNPMFITALSALSGLVIYSLAHPYLAPIAAGVPQMVKRYTNQDDAVRQQEQANKQLSDNSTEPTKADLNEAMKTQIMQLISYYQQKSNQATNPIEKREYDREIRKLERKIQSLGNQQNGQ